MSKKLIATSGTEFAQNMATFAIIDDKNRAGKPLMLDAATLEEAFENASSDDRAAFKAILDFDLEGSYVKPEDANLLPENIKAGVTIYGVEGTYTGEVVPGGDS